VHFVMCCAFYVHRLLKNSVIRKPIEKSMEREFAESVNTEIATITEK